MNTKSLVLAIAVLGLSSGFVLAHEGHDEATEAQEKATNAQVVVISEKTPASKDAVEVGNKLCPVSGDKIPAPGEKGTMGDNPVKVEYKGELYNLCCPMCVKDFKKNPEKYSAIANKEVSGNK